MTGPQQALLMAAGATDSPPAPVWGETMLPVSKNWGATMYGGGAWVVAGEDVTPTPDIPIAAYSTDGGHTWTQAPAFSAVGGVGFEDNKSAFGNGIFGGAIANLAQVFRSSDGGQTWTVPSISWTSPPGSFTTPVHMIFAPFSGLFCMTFLTGGGASERFATASDPAGPWTRLVMPDSSTWGPIAEDASNGDVYVSSSTNGVSKNLASPVSLPGTNNIKWLAAGDGKVLATSATRVIFSADGGVTYNLSTTLDNTGTSYSRPRYVDGYFYIMQVHGDLAWYSATGDVWTSAPVIDASSALVQSWDTDGAGGFVSCVSPGTASIKVYYAPNISGVVSPLPNAVIADTGAGSRSAMIGFSPNGAMTFSGNAASMDAPQAWYTLPRSNIGASYWARLTVVSGSNPSSGQAVSTWINLTTSDKTWTWTQAAVGVKSATIRLELSLTSGGAIISTSPDIAVTVTSV